MLAYGDSGYRLAAPFLLLCGDSTRESYVVPTPRLINREHYFLLKAAHFQMYDVVVSLVYTTPVRHVESPPEMAYT
jgi:hypothetical protein